jgi:hypothetical protein
VLAIGGVHQLVPVLDVARALGQGPQDQELGDRQVDRLTGPGAEVTPRVQHQLAARQRLLGPVRFQLLPGHLLAPQQGTDPLEQEALGEGLGDVVVGAQAQAQHLVHLVVLGGQEDDRNIGIASQVGQQLHAVHARHLDIQDGQVHRIARDAAQGLRAVGVGPHLEAFGFERHGYRGQYVPVVVDQGDGLLHNRLPQSTNVSGVPPDHTGIRLWRFCGALGAGSVSCP